MEAHTNSKRVVIPFERIQAKALKKDQYHTYKLFTNPLNTNFPIYKLTIPFFDCGTPEEWIKLFQGITTILKGQNVTSGIASYVVIKTLLKEDTLMLFKKAEVTYVTQSMTNFEKCLDEVTIHIFSEKAYWLQKQFIQRCLQKYKDIPFKEWVVQVLKLNNYLKEFLKVNSPVELKLIGKEVMEVLENRVPHTWCREFTIQGIDPVIEVQKKFSE